MTLLQICSTAETKNRSGTSDHIWPSGIWHRTVWQMGAGFERNLLHLQSKNIPEDGDHRFFLNADTYLQTMWQHIPEDCNLYRTNLTADEACNMITKMHLTFWLHILEGQVSTTVWDETAWHQFSTSSSSPPPPKLLLTNQKMAPIRYHWPQDPALTAPTTAPPSLSYVQLSPLN